MQQEQAWAARTESGREAKLVAAIVLAVAGARAAPPAAPSARARRRPGRRLGRGGRVLTGRRVQDDPERPDYKIALERAMLTASRDVRQRARASSRQAISSKRRCGSTARRASSSRRTGSRPRARELERMIRDRIEADASEAARSRSCASRRAAGRDADCSTRHRAIRRSSVHQLQPARHPQLHRQRHRHQRHLRPRLPGQGLHASSSRASRWSRRCSRSCRQSALLQGAEPEDDHRRRRHHRRSARSTTSRSSASFFVSHADAHGAVADADRIMRVAGDAVQPTIVANKTGQHDHRPRHRAGRGRSSSGSSRPTTSRAPK